MRKPAAIYARVSSDRQKENHTIASQTAALIQHAETQDEGYSGASLVRPGLEALRDLAAQGHIEAVLAHSPDRLSRKYAYQILLAEEFNRQGVELVFLKAPSATPEDQLVVQFQGMIAEYERTQIIERSPPRQAASGAARDHQRTLGRSVRLSLCEKVGQCDSLL
jgi:site-specific DNA recombinase